MGQRVTIFIARIILWFVLVPIAIPIVLLGMFLVSARWVIYFFAALLLMIMALGSKQYANHFWLAFFVPFFVGGLLEGVVMLIAERMREGQPATR